MERHGSPTTSAVLDQHIGGGPLGSAFVVCRQAGFALADDLFLEVVLEFLIIFSYLRFETLRDLSIERGVRQFLPGTPSFTACVTHLHRGLSR